MNQRRAMLATAIAVGLVAAPFAHAQTRPAKAICNLLTDPAGDVQVVVPDVGPQNFADPGMDIRSLDVASDRKRLGITLRLGGAPGSLASTHADPGVSDFYYVFVTLQSTGRELIFLAEAPADNPVGASEAMSGAVPWRFSVGHFSTNSGLTYANRDYFADAYIHGAVEPGSNDIRMSVTWPQLKKLGVVAAAHDRIVNVHAWTHDRWLATYRGDGVLLSQQQWDDAPQDSAASKRTYPLGTKTCSPILP